MIVSEIPVYTMVVILSFYRIVYTISFVCHTFTNGDICGVGGWIVDYGYCVCGGVV